MNRERADYKHQRPKPCIALARGKGFFLLAKSNVWVCLDEHGYFGLGPTPADAFHIWRFWPRHKVTPTCSHTQSA